jgi:multidrug efflux system membrane fusion protein
MQHRLLAAVIGLLLLLGATHPNVAQEAPEPQVVPVAKAVVRAVTDYVDLTGRTSAQHMVDVKARVTGYLVSTPFKEGSLVQTGEVLFEIDPRPYKAQLDEQEAELRLARAQLRLAQLTLDRDRATAKAAPAAVSQQQLDQDRAAVDVAEARVAARLASVEAARLTLQHTKVTAPIAGQVGRCLVTLGNLVNQDQTLLTTLVSLDPMYAYCDMDEVTLLRIVRAVKVGNAKPLAQGQIPVFMGLQDEDGYPHRGTIDFVDNQINPTTDTIRVRGVFPNPKTPQGGRLLAPGMFVRLRLPLGAPHAALLVTDRAIGSDQGQRFLYVVDAQNKVQYRRVKTGALQEDGLRVIADGLKAGDSVVVGGLARLRPGLTVRPEATAMPALVRPPGEPEKAPARP